MCQGRPTLQSDVWEVMFATIFQNIMCRLGFLLSFRYIFSLQIFNVIGLIICI